MNLLHLIRKKWIIVILLALCAMAILQPASSLADGKGATFSGDGWYGAVGDVDISSFEVIPEFKLDVETKWKVIPVGVSLKMNFTVRIGVKGNFDVTFEKANLPRSPRKSLPSGATCISTSWEIPCLTIFRMSGWSGSI